MILNRNQLDYCSPKGQVGGLNPPRVSKLIQQLQFVTVFVKIYNPKKHPKHRLQIIYKKILDLKDITNLLIERDNTNSLAIS